MQTIIETINLSKTVAAPEGELTILKNVSMSISEGSSVAIVGSSGSGKSTLLGLLAGLDTPSAGKVIMDGEDFSTLDEDGRALVRAGRVGFVFQSFQLVHGLSALENVMLPMELAGQDDARERAQQILAQVGLSQRGGHYPAQLSGGEQQRVAIARAFAVQPKILFADEPTGNLDQKTGASIIELLFNMNNHSKTTLVLVTHDNNLANQCGVHYQLEAGQLV
ncbi:MAG: ABC transporter ATP-binding protein [Gammaproteobacteria bacterium]|nr:ABC transporter ATP-binding protein [Gammaproteobacteria bacterium]